MIIQVLGSGCPTCHRLKEMAEEIAKEAGKGDTVEYITGEKGTAKIIELGIMSSPVLIAGGKVAMTGFIPDKEAIRKKIYGHI